MKALFSIFSVVLFFSLSTFADAPNDEKSAKLIRIVNKADKNDWRTLNKAAALAINWNADLELAKSWVEASILISDNAEAYELLGDYYLRKGDTKNAYKNYNLSLEKGMFNLGAKDFDRIQRKVLTFGKALQ
ncbi:hypothetical protein [Flammeovirga kamogawensis]|uniref:Tetratricopeptide repeat protein n=1 Tax=Flammeovirga kamogawensis TaxID=373891 RepID=A0ABX8GW38_9BACT|nr:hypothetical protein [Flammeovirga kamogawensis]MBB6461187.1 hypothetical protein [Flammeovirga kamogawensis]QWG07751.1 hypothetical protein KM029_02080 [Flammeovirga kamogawensis]TRX69557.1 hypothetical protein EO216_16015 [Flammeovirga kamogawensis]